MLLGSGRSVEKTAKNCDFMLKKAHFAHFAHFGFPFLAFSGHNFKTLGPILTRDEPIDSSEKSLHFRHQFLMFYLKIA